MISFKSYFVIGIISTLIFVFTNIVSFLNLPVPENILLSFSFFGVLTFSFTIGIVALLPFRRNFSLFNFVFFPIIISTGLILNVIWMYSLAVFTLNPFVMNSLFIISQFLFFLFFVKQFFIKINYNQFSKQHFKEKISHYGVIFLIIFLIFTITVLSLINFYQYPVLRSDLTDYHTALTQSIISQEHLSYYYNSEVMFDIFHRHYNEREPIPYPQGWHVTTAVYSLFFGINSVQMGFVLSGLVISLIFGCLIALTFSISKSILISLVSIIPFFYTGIRGTQEFYLYGTFITGLAPLIIGILGILSILVLIFSINKEKKYSLSIFIAILIGIGITHPPSVMYLILIMIAYLALNHNNEFLTSIKKYFKNIFSRNFSINDLVLCIILVGVVIGGTYQFQINTILGYASPHNYSAIIENDADVFLGLSRSIDDGYVLTFSIVLIISIIFNIFYIKENRKFSLVILAFVFPIFFVSSFEFLTLLFIPIRLSVLLIPFSWIMLGITIFSLEKMIFLKFITKSNITDISNSQSTSSNVINFNIHWFFHYRFLVLIYFGISILLFYESMIEIFNFNSLIYEILPTHEVVCFGPSLRCT